MKSIFFQETYNVVFISSIFKIFIDFRILLAALKQPVFYIQLNPKLSSVPEFYPPMFCILNSSFSYKIFTFASFGIQSKSIYRVVFQGYVDIENTSLNSIF